MRSGEDRGRKVGGSVSAGIPPCKRASTHNGHGRRWVRSEDTRARDTEMACFHVCGARRRQRHAHGMCKLRSRCVYAVRRGPPPLRLGVADGRNDP
eukprot:1920248-Prymnesium_polylepis.1